MHVPPTFLYFDLGNVLLTFDNDRACRQMAEVADIPPGQLRDFFGAHDLQDRLERGELTFADVHSQLCDELGRKIDGAAFQLAYSDIFGINAGIVPLVARLAEANLPLGILSNTSEPHWNHVTDGRFAILPRYFGCFALSFRIKAMKPDPAIFVAAQRLAGVAGSQIFFTDDRPENVAGALAAGWDAVPFTSPRQLAADLHDRGLQFNY